MSVSQSAARAALYSVISAYGSQSIAAYLRCTEARLLRLVAGEAPISAGVFLKIIDLLESSEPTLTGKTASPPVPKGGPDTETST